jgi:glycosyltransferase involved in cell wall biosynthesis
MITLAIPSYNRSHYVIEAFLRVLDDSRISEVLIVDDFSSEIEYSKLENLISSFSDLTSFSKIRLIRNEKNLGSFFNKKKCVEESKNDWIILLDSDNSIDVRYLDSIINKKDPKILYTPSHAECNSRLLDYREYSNEIVDKNRYKKILKEERNLSWDCILNTGNYFFNKKSYLECINREKILVNSFAADAFYLIYLWMKNIEDAKLEVVSGMEYSHRLHEQSHWSMNSQSSDNFVLKIIDDIIKWN